jgi:prevent-host-death family protein
MEVPARHLEVGVRELRDGLSRFLELVAEGAEITVTDRGRPVARITGRETALDRLVAAGAVRPPRRPKSPSAAFPRLAVGGSVSELVARQRR